MILVTVGAQMPFDRLVRVVDAYAGATGADVFAQIGATSFTPRHLTWRAHLDPIEFREKVFQADVIIAHAGMGTILTAMEFGKPLLIMPRRSDLKETRNDHQFATARAFEERGRATVAWNDEELGEALRRLDGIACASPIASHASFQLLTALRRFIRPDESVADAGAAVAAAEQTLGRIAPAPMRERKAA